MFKKVSLYIFLISYIPFCLAQKYPQNDFRSPVDFPIILAGSFGELRTNHFHSGIDIKTQGVSGKKIYTAKEGYVSRIKVSLWGYGKALYITHPNGFTTVYGHLQKFSDKIEAYIKKKQYKQKSFETQVFPNKDELPVFKDEIVAISGNSGGSSGPHLHFEIRDSKTEKIINPLLFGLKVVDNIAPTFLGLRAIPLNKNTYINTKNVAQVLPKRLQSKNVYIADTVKALGKIGFAIHTYDKFNYANNKNGVYKISMYVNDTLSYQHKMETFAFSETKYINLHFDYKYYSKYYKKYQKTFIENPNKLSTYLRTQNNGHLLINDNNFKQVKIILEDINSNKTSIIIPVKGYPIKNEVDEISAITPYLVKTDQYHVFKQGMSELRFPKNTFYENTYIDYQYSKNKIKVHKSNMPLNKSYTLTYFTDSIPENRRPYLYFARKSRKVYNYTNTLRKKGKIYTNTKGLGDFYLRYDSIKPVIYKPSFYHGQNIKTHRALSIYIKDNHAGIKNYYGSIDDQWILLEYEPKKRKLTYNFKDIPLNPSIHTFKLKVEDLLGNTNSYIAKFYR